jgi:hypothetical protein
MSGLPGSRHLTGRISNHQVSVGNLVSGSDSATTPAMTTIVSLDRSLLSI